MRDIDRLEIALYRLIWVLAHTSANSDAECEVLAGAWLDRAEASQRPQNARSPEE